MDIGKSSWILLLVLVIEVVISNFIIPQKWPKIIGDILIEKPGGYRFYIPIVSPFVITALVLLTINYFFK